MPMLNQKYCRFCDCPVPWDYVDSGCRTELHPNRATTYAHHECFDLWTEANKPRVKAAMDDFNSFVEKQRMEVAGGNCPNCNEPFQDDDTVIAGKHLVCPSTITDAKPQNNPKSDFCPCQTWAGGGFNLGEHHPYCDGKGQNKYGYATEADIVFTHAKPTDLELLVIDLGDSCAVKVEKGSYSTVTGLVKPLNTTYPRKIDQPFVVEHSFFELRKAIEGDKPVPRIIRDNEGYLLVEDANTNEFLAKDTYDALSQLAGKPLPIHSNGTWEQLVTTNGVTIWKYSR